MKSRSWYNILRVTAIVLLFVVSLNALAAGYSFMTDPSGNGLGISINYLKPSAPFQNYFIPGLVLFVMIGLVSSFVAVQAIRKTRIFPLLLAGQGGIIFGWIAVQLTMVTVFHPLHLIIATIGAMLMITGWILRKDAVRKKWA